MPKESEGARQVRAELAEMFGDKRLLTIGDVASYTGRTRKICKKLFFGADNPLAAEKLISVVRFANKMG